MLLVISDVSGSPGKSSKTVFVKNLSFDTSEEDLKDAFDGAVAVRILADRETGKSRGYETFAISRISFAVAMMIVLVIPV